ncbi:chitobiase/beta-hexosaminidase C-terminal domain-containing protein [Bacteroidota bacterium]
MTPIKSIYLICVLCVFFSTSWATDERVKVFSKLNYYTSEETGQIVIKSGDAYMDKGYSLELFHEDESLGRIENINKPVTLLDFNLAKIHSGTHMLICRLFRDGEKTGEFYAEVVKLAHKANEVKINLLTGGLIADGLPFFPFGFYCSSPVGDLSQQEVVSGFNLIAPYQRITDETLHERKEYMDRAAELGLKVHYALNGLVGAGHNNLKTSEQEENEKLEILKKEVIMFRDHPALLAWYINDEPIGQGRPVELLEKTYQLVREIDPYHPSSIVFMTPERAVEFENAMDIAMTDPYPVPGNMEMVVEDVQHLNRQFGTSKSNWLVPQAFGGGEFWTREPTKQELRLMTYMGIVSGAKGIQYFIRRGPNLFPKSPDTWSECGMMAMEIAEMSPYLLSEESAPDVTVNDDKILVNGWKYKGSILIIATNKVNQPRSINISLVDSDLKGEATAIFENRSVNIKNGNIQDMIGAYGTRVYRIKEIESENMVEMSESNLILNPSFEENASVGIPNECYAGHSTSHGDPGATYFLDNRTAVHGTHSLRLITPVDSGGIRLNFYHIPLVQDNSYTISVWAKAKTQEDLPSFRLEIGRMNVSETFRITSNWDKYTLTFTVDENIRKPGVSLDLITQGTAWFDLLQVDPDPSISYSINPDMYAEITMTSVDNSLAIRYTTNGTPPTIRSKLYSNVLKVNKPMTIKAGIFNNDQLVAVSNRFIPVNIAYGKRVTFKESYSSNYSSKGDISLTDGILGSSNFKDSQWLGFEGSDATMTIDLMKISKFTKAWANFLCDVRSGIHLPVELVVETSIDGKAFTMAGRFENKEISEEGPAYIETMTVDTGKIKARYIRITAKSIIKIPEGYLFKDTNAWTFIDEIMVE